MSETSRDYERGFAKLLPDHWWSELTANHTSMNEPPPCPDIREPGNEALAWRALRVLPGKQFRRWAEFLCFDNSSSLFAPLLYAAVEAVGRE